MSIQVLVVNCDIHVSLSFPTFSFVHIDYTVLLSTYALMPGRIKGDVDSLFNYAPGESYSTYARTGFKPLFIEDVLLNMTTEQRTKAKETCGDNKECLFDFAVTGSLFLKVNVV